MNAKCRSISQEIRDLAIRVIYLIDSDRNSRRLNTAMTCLRKLIFICLFGLGIEVTACACFYQGPFSLPEIRILTADNPVFALPEYDDHSWPLFLNDQLTEIDGVFWVRADFFVDPSVKDSVESFEFRMSMLAAYEVYIDGELIGRSGRVGATRDAEVPGPYINAFPIPRDVIRKGHGVLALRMSSWYRIKPDKAFFDPFGSLGANTVFQEMIILTDTIDNRMLNASDVMVTLFVTIPFFAACYFLLVFLGHRQATHYLVFSVFCASLFVLGVGDILRWVVGYPYSWHYVQWWVIGIAVQWVVLLFPAFFLVRFKMKGKWAYLLLAFALSMATSFLSHDRGNTSIGEQLMIESFAFVVLIHLLFAFTGGKGSLPTLAVVSIGLALSITNSSLLYFSFSLVILVVFALLAREQFLQRRQYLMSVVEAGRLKSELLRKNIQPHFLMNSLTSLVEWVEVDPEKGAEFVEALADEFRILNQIAEKPLIPIAQELDMCRLHLRIMGFRLKKNFELVLGEVDETGQIPPTLFHALCENGITHNKYVEHEIDFHLNQIKLPDGIRFEFSTPMGRPSIRQNKNTGSGHKMIAAQLERAYPGRWKMANDRGPQNWVTRIDVFEKASRA